ncbi:carboxylic ester hydrolase-like [Diachasmimorpha longicaudata]|uniref:carboxylic ester hydrolase-like n=1 Tax=Diachasmimorpha longicaudata TaxID=58733 RepID=UPI0030B8D184
MPNMWYKYVYLWSTCFIISSAKASLNEPIVHTKLGTIRGKWLRSVRNVDVAAFLGVPYAEPPIGSLRFENPRNWTGHWKQIHNAVEDGPPCVQPTNDGRIIGKEDCLYLNIYVPAIPYDSKLSVLVFIGGEDFITGSNNSTELAPDYLMDQGIIVVTVNYRLGILGFLSTGNEAGPGNYGVKDVFLALQWIQTNIEDFGGDINSVTLSGASAGAALAHHLVLSNRTEGLFHQLITHSGSALAPWAMHPARFARIRYLAVAVAMNCTTRDKIMDIAYMPTTHTLFEDIQQVTEDTKILECLRNSYAHDITEKLSLFDEWFGSPHGIFGPTLEPDSDGALITRNPRTIIANEEFRDIPWITGVVSDEGLLRAIELQSNNSLLEALAENLEEAIPIILEMEEVVADVSLFTEELMEFYFPEGFRPNRTDFFENITALLGDGLFYYWSYEGVVTQAEKMNSSVYSYVFSYQGTFSSTLENRISARLGVSHGDDINYLFPFLNSQLADLQLYNTIEDTTMINIMTEMISSFVKRGAPFAQLTPDWRPYQEDFRFMRLGMEERSPDISMERYFLPIRMDFWYRLMSNVSVPREQLFFELYEDDSAEDLAKEESTNAISGHPECISFPYIILLCTIYFLV